jgi:outer membrane protein assembly factor BamE
MKKIFLVSLMLATLSACGLIYRVDVQQGNVITSDMVAQLKLGMDENQVRYIMGNPLALSVFRSQSQTQRWDYFYSYRKGWDEPQTLRLNLYFDNGLLSRIEGDIAHTPQHLPRPPIETDESRDNAPPIL